MNLNYSSHLHVHPFRPVHQSYPFSFSFFSPDRVFRWRRSAIIARPLGWPQTTTHRKISPILSFFRHFHRGNRTHPTWTLIFPNSFSTFSVATWRPLGKQNDDHPYVSHRISILLPAEMVGPLVTSIISNDVIYLMMTSNYSLPAFPGRRNN